MKKHFSTWFLSLIILTLFLNGCNKYDLDLNDFFKENEQTSTEEYIKENGSGEENSIPESETGPEVLPPDSLRILDTNTYERMHFTYRNIKWYFVLESAKGTDIDSTIDFGNMNSLVNKYTTSQGKSYYIQKKDNYSEDSTIKTFEFTLDYETFKKIAENEYMELKDFIPAIKGIEIPVNVSFKDSNGNTVANSFIIILTAPIPQLKKSSLFIDNTSGNYIYKFAIPDELFKDYYDNYFDLYFYSYFSTDNFNSESIYMYMSARFNKINQTFEFNDNNHKLKLVNYQNESKLTFVNGSKGYYNENHIFYIDTGITAKENSIKCNCGISSIFGDNTQYYNILERLKPVPKIISPIKKVQNDNELSIETLESNQFVKNVEFIIPATAIDMTDNQNPDEEPVEEQIDQILKISYTVWNGTKEANNYIKNENQILKSITITANSGEIISIEMEKGISFVEFHIETVQENSNYVSNTDKTFIFEINGGDWFTFVGNNETQIQLGTESHPYTALENIITEELFNFSESIYIYIKDELPATDPEFIIPENKTAFIIPTGNTNIKMSTPITLSDSKLSIASGFNLSECEITSTGTSSIISSQINDSTINITDSSSLSVQNSTVNSSIVKLGVGSIFVIKEKTSLSDNQFNMTLSDENSPSRIRFETKPFYINNNTITAEPEYFNSTDFYNKPAVITVDPLISIAFDTEFVSKWNIPQYQGKMFKIAGDDEISKNQDYVLGSIIEDLKTVSKFESVQGISVVTFTIEETTSKISFTIDEIADDTKAYIDGIEVELTGNSVLISNLEKGNHSLTFTAIVYGVIHSCDYFFSK